MKVGLVLRGYLILNRIQIFYLFKALYNKFLAAHASHKVPPMLPFFSFWIQCPKEFWHPPSLRPRGAWASLFFYWFLDLGCFIIKERRERKEKKKKIKKRIKKLIAIQASFRFDKLNFGEPKFKLKKTIPGWSWVDTCRGRTLVRLRKNLFSFRSRFEEKDCETGMWFDHNLNFSIY